MFPTHTRLCQSIIEYPPLPSRGPGLSLVDVAVRVVVRVAVCVLYQVVTLVVTQCHLEDQGEDEEEATVKGLHANPELTCN